MSALAVAAVLAAPLPAAAASSSVATPRPPASLPPAVEPLPVYVGQAACDPAGKPGALALGRLLTATYPGTTYGVDRSCGDGGTVSEHYEGRAVDWMVRADRPEQKAQADAFLTWLLAPDAAGNPVAMARRLGVMYVIWDKRIFSVYRPVDGWRPYACSDVTSCHSDHVHLSLTWDGAFARTSFWTGAVAGGTDFGPCRPADLNWAPRHRARNGTRCASHPRVSAPAGASPTLAGLVRFGGAELAQGSRGAAVRALQTGLGVAADGTFGTMTLAALQDLQRRRGLPVTGVADAATWRALLAAAATPGTPPVPSPAPAPAPAPAPPPAPALGPVEARVQALGSSLGPVTGPELPTPDGLGRYRHLAGGSVYWSPATGARVVQGAIREAWARLRWEGGPLGYPVTDELRAPDGVGRHSRFQGGSVSWSPGTGAHSVQGAIHAVWSQAGGEAGPLGYPVTDELRTPDGVGRYTHFQGGSVYWSPRTGAHLVRGAIRDTWARLRWEGGPLGYPVTDELRAPDGVGRYTRFQGGSVSWSPGTGAHSVQGAIHAVWSQAGGEAGPLGYPVTDELRAPDGVGRYTHFQGGSVYWSPRTGAHLVRGSINAAWARLGRELSPLGYPTRGEYDVAGGRASDFERGRIVWTAATGATRVELR